MRAGRAGRAYSCQYICCYYKNKAALSKRSIIIMMPISDFRFPDFRFRISDFPDFRNRHKQKKTDPRKVKTPELILRISAQVFPPRIPILIRNPGYNFIRD